MSDTALLVWPAPPPSCQSQHVAKVRDFLVVGALKTIPGVRVGVRVGVWDGVEVGIEVWTR